MRRWLGKGYERAGELCEELDQRQHLGAVLYGQFTYQNVRGEYRPAEETVAAALRIVRALRSASVAFRFRTIAQARGAPDAAE